MITGLGVSNPVRIFVQRAQEEEINKQVRKETAQMDHFLQCIAMEKAPEAKSWSIWLTRLIKHYHTQACFDFLIAIYFVYKCVAVQNDSPMKVAEIVFQALFMIDISIHIYGYGFSHYLQSFWNLTDICIVTYSLFSLFTADVSSKNHFRIFRMFDSRITDVKILAIAIFKSMKSSFWLFVMLVIIMSTYSIIGTECFGASMNDEFGSWSRSMFTLLQVLTGDAWASELGREAMSGSSRDKVIAALFFVTFICGCGIVMMNVVQAVFIEGYLSSYRESSDYIRDANIREVFHLMDIDNDGHLTKTDLLTKCISLSEHSQTLDYTRTFKKLLEAEDEEIGFAAFRDAFIEDVAENTDCTITKLIHCQNEQMEHISNQLNNVMSILKQLSPTDLKNVTWNQEQHEEEDQDVLESQIR